MTRLQTLLAVLAMSSLSSAAVASPEANPDTAGQEQGEKVETIAQAAPPPAGAPQPYPQPSGYGAPQPPPPPGPVPPPPPELSGTPGVLNDAGSSGMWLAPTALMAPKGTWTFEDNELFFVGGSYAFTDKFAVSAHTLIPLGQDAFPFVLSGKAGLVDTGKLRLAVTGNIFAVAGGGDAASSVGVGGVGSLCIDDDCNSFLNGYLGGLVLLDSEASQTSLPLVFSVGITQRLSKRVKLLVEVDGGAIVGDYDAVADGVLAWYGVRFFGRYVAVNVGFAKPFIEDAEIEELPLGLPWVGLTYRGLPE